MNNILSAALGPIKFILPDLSEIQILCYSELHQYNTIGESLLSVYCTIDAELLDNNCNGILCVTL